MVSLEIDRKRLVRELGVGDTPELLTQIAQFGVEVDAETPETLTLDITPNRPDLLSYRGFLRGFAAFLDRQPGLRHYTTTPSKVKVTAHPSLQGIRPFTSCAVVTGLKIDDAGLQEIIDLQEKLHITFCRRRKRAAIGIYPLDRISGNITFTAKKPKDIVFQPLDADREMTATQILTETPKGKEFAHLLEGLSEYPVFIDAKGKVLSMPPVINSVDVGKVTKETTEVFIESSGADQRICDEIVRIICCALADSGAQIKSVMIENGKRSFATPDLSAHKHEFYGYYVERRLGVSIKTAAYPALLAKMGLGHEPGRVKDTHRALVPPYRVDFLHQVDIIEDIAIALGYDSIPATQPTLVTAASTTPMSRLTEVARRALLGFGLTEAKGYHLTSGAFQAAIGESAPVRLRSSVSSEHDTLRVSIIPTLLETLRVNASYPYPQSWFEIGVAFSPLPRAVSERTLCCVALAGEGDYTRARQIAETITRTLGLATSVAVRTDARFISGRCATLLSGDREIGVIGELAPAAISAAGIVVPVAIAQLDLTAILTLLQK